MLPGSSCAFFLGAALRYAERGRMRWPVILALLHLIAIAPLGAQPAPAASPGATEAPSVLTTLVTIPSGDLRRVSLPRMGSGASLEVSYHALSPEAPVELELLRRERGGEGKPVFRHHGRIPVTADGRFQYSVPEAGDFLLVLRQTERTGKTARVHLQVRIQGASTTVATEVRTLPRETRIAVAIFSVGFLWTTLLVCGVPVIRAFRSRKTPSSHLWYG